VTRTRGFDPFAENGMCDRISTAVAERLTDLTDRFIQETNDFLSCHRDDPGAGWPLKCAVQQEVEELITRLLHRCRVIHPQEGGGCPRYAILFVVDSGSVDTAGGAPQLTTRVLRPPVRRKRLVEAR
jgi:hypothetical protein